MSNFSHIIEPGKLASLDADVLIIDLCSDQQYARGHVPGAVHVSPQEIVDGHPPAPGKLPEKHRLDGLFSRIGFEPGKTVVVYDDEGGGWAGRMAWTLDVIGHDNWLYLNGGLHAWIADGLPLETAPVAVRPSHCDVRIHTGPIVEAGEIIANLGDPEHLIWDARSREEYEGSRVVARRGGHIPGAIHCEWTTLMDKSRGLRIREDARELLDSLGLTADREIATHCQSHHRSGFTYLVARALGYPRIRAYHGSWSEWGNREDTPVETGPGT